MEDGKRTPAILELLANDKKRCCEATPVASKAAYCDTMRQSRRKTDVRDVPKAGGDENGVHPWGRIPWKTMQGENGRDRGPPKRESAGIELRGLGGIPSHKTGETPRKAWPGTPRHSRPAETLRAGVTKGEAPQKGKGKDDGTRTSSSASATRVTQEEEGETGGIEEYQPTGSPLGHVSRELDSTPRSERRQRFAALGRDIQALAQELEKKDEKESDEEDATEIRAMRGRHSFNFLA